MFILAKSALLALVAASNCVVDGFMFSPSSVSGFTVSRTNPGSPRLMMSGPARGAGVGVALPARDRRLSVAALRASQEEAAAVEEEKAGDSAETNPQDLPNDKLIYDPRSGRFFEKEIEEVCREEYCAIDEVTGKPVALSKGEKERIFLDAIQSFYYSGRKLLDDDDFDRLKEDLVWEGSKVVLFSRDERLFMNAMAAYLKGEPILPDAEFDKLKADLREAGSPVAVSKEPKCYIDTGICTVTFQEDKFRRFTTYLPATFIFGLTMLGVSYQVIEPLHNVNPIISLAVLSAPAIYAALKFTDAVLYQNDGLIAYGPCPSCGKSSHIFFGNILGVEGFNTEGEFKCSSCNEQIFINRADLRARTRPKI